ncbi:preprotein translocase subunit SecG [Qipengyuania spongiae]|uniref:Protein-export membrane protein SecG n=1 Tax=Qipengyuania spongiae TaxID=2909673 RepID=A0ABY5T664_9SPHN|nr:preprotein translocase subunit SecG [Qipengyuania spongiae]UVI40818.1 preprotein translocase subunit SecG [Qipengyuania spongiae]
MFLFLTVVQAIVAAALVGVILMQRSEGGGLGIGGSPTGMLSARGAADFLTRSTRWLAILFVVLSILLAAMAAETGSATIESTLDRSVTPAESDPLGGGVLGGPTTAPDPAAPAGEAPAEDPLAQ